MWYLPIVEREMVPDAILRYGIRRMIEKSLGNLSAPDMETRQKHRQRMIEKFSEGPIAINTDDANEQHYELPAEFFQIVLGKRLKYSSCYWPHGVANLEDAENEMLRLTCQRAELADGQSILELGCGWGSLSLWMAEHYPGATITAVSNSRTQREYIQAQAAVHGFNNLTVITANMVDFDIDQRFDRVVSVEMFEHMKNYQELMANIARWLNPGGRLFVHHFSHHDHIFEFEPYSNDWMAQHFFSGGTMPSDDLLLHFQDDLKIVRRWRVDGTHYERTLNTWLNKMDASETKVRKIMRNVYGPKDAQRWFVYWRLFFIVCAEVFGARDGRSYFVTHQLYEKRV